VGLTNFSIMQLISYSIAQGLLASRLQILAKAAILVYSVKTVNSTTEMDSN